MTRTGYGHITPPNLGVNVLMREQGRKTCGEVAARISLERTIPTLAITPQHMTGRSDMMVVYILMMAVLYTKAFDGHNRVWPTQACHVHAERVCEKEGMLLCMPPTQLSAGFSIQQCLTWEN